MKYIKTLIGTLTFTLVNLVRIQAQDPFTNGLVAYYPFNGNANDESGNGQDGIVIGATLTDDGQGNPLSNCYTFDGTDHIDLPLNAGGLPGSREFSLSVWIKPGASPAGAVFAHWSSLGASGGTPVGFYMTVSGGELALSLRAGRSIIVTNFINGAMWQQMVVAYDGSATNDSARLKV